MTGAFIHLFIGIVFLSLINVYVKYIKHTSHCMRLEYVLIAVLRVFDRAEPAKGPV